jgi:two-component system, NtrC family, response regulator AtoC
MKYDILVVDDEPLVRSSLRRLLSHREWHVTDVPSGAAACAAVARDRYDVAIIDYNLGDMTGLEVLDVVREKSPDTVPVLLTAYGTVNLAVEALKKGAYDFLQKDSDPKVTRHVVENALEKARLRREVERLRQERLSRAHLPQIVYRSRAMQHVMEAVDEYARTDATVLIEGETGVGKSLVAEFIHYASERGNGPFVTINCGAIPNELIESELFGYAEGAFTGARLKGKIGLVKRADGGTLFLDEIGDLSLDLQSKLLHVLERREFLAVGAVEPTKVDVRFVAATNADLAKRIADDRFRRDLYYRLAVATVFLPPLRERREDILPLARHFINRLNDRLGREVAGLTEAAELRLHGHAWAGNVRELHNVVERSMLRTRADQLDGDDLLFLSENGMGMEGGCSLKVEFSSGHDVLLELSRQVVLQAWEQSGHNQSQAARMLGIPRTTFQTYMQRFDL